MEELLDVKTKNFSVIGRNSVLKGDFIFQGLTRISCEIEGKITTTEESMLILEKDSNISGDIKCHDIEIHGIFDGKINANGKIVAYPSAKVSGEIHCSSLIIYPGAFINIEGHAEE